MRRAMLIGAVLLLPLPATTTVGAQAEQNKTVKAPAKGDAVAKGEPVDQELRTKLRAIFKAAALKEPALAFHEAQTTYMAAVRRDAPEDELLRLALEASRLQGKVAEAAAPALQQAEQTGVSSEVVDKEWAAWVSDVYEEYDKQKEKEEKVKEKKK